MKKIYPTMVTPFHKDRSINWEGVDALVEWYIAQGCDGVFAVCQSSEMFYLSQEEKYLLVKRVVEKSAGRLDVIASGHTSASFDEQSREMSAAARAGASAVIFVSNRFAEAHEGDMVFLDNLKRVADRIPESVRFGIYECPYPYKRLLSTKIMEALVKDGRFAFIKDTCCDLALIKERSEIVVGSGLKLYNANAGSLLYSLRLGYTGYSGVMANFHPDIYVQLLNSDYNTSEAEKLQNFISTAAYMELQNYPANAKYHLQLCGLPLEAFVRKGDKPLSPLHCAEIQSLKDLAQIFR